MTKQTPEFEFGFELLAWVQKHPKAERPAALKAALARYKGSDKKLVAAWAEETPETVDE